MRKDCDWDELFKQFDGCVTPQFSESPRMDTIYDPTRDVKRFDEHNGLNRYFGSGGVKKLERCSVLLLNASVSGLEAIRLLSLFGVGMVTIVDERKVTEKDLGKNLYVKKEDIGENIAVVASSNLYEHFLGVVKMRYMVVNVNKVVENAPDDFFSEFDVILACGMSFELTRKIHEMVRKEETKEIIVISLRSHGMMGYYRAYSNQEEGILVNSRPENPIIDLRLHKPWESYKRFIDLQDLETMSKRDLCSTPFPVILGQVSNEWLRIHEDRIVRGYEFLTMCGTVIPIEITRMIMSYLPTKNEDDVDNVRRVCKLFLILMNSRNNYFHLPSTEEEKEEFVGLLLKKHYSFGRSENFKEALENSFRAYTVPKISDDVMKILERATTTMEFDEDTPMIWFLAYGVGKFFRNEGKGKELPFEGDEVLSRFWTHSDPVRLERMKSIFRRKFRRDARIVQKYIRSLCEEKKLKEPYYADIQYFCKHVRNLKYLRFKSLDRELDDKDFNRDGNLRKYFKGTGKSQAFLYCCLRANEVYFQKFGKYPGEKLDDDLEVETTQFFEILKDLVRGRFKIDQEAATDSDLRKYSEHWVRCGSCELHTISSLLGGVAAQEIAKLVSGVRIPLTHTWIYNGIDSTSIEMEL